MRAIPNPLVPAVALLLAACGGAGPGSSPDTATAAYPLSSEIKMQPDDVLPTAQVPDQQGVMHPGSLFAATREGVEQLNADLGRLLDTIHTIATHVPPVVDKEGRRVFVFTDDQGHTVRLVLSRNLLGEITYQPDDELPDEAGLDEGQGRLGASVVADRFVLEIKKASEDETAYRLAARGHVVRLAGIGQGVGAIAVRSVKFDDLEQAPAERFRVGVRFDHRGLVHRQLARVHAYSDDNQDVRVAWGMRRIPGVTGGLQLVRFGDLPNTPVAGGKPELVLVQEQWLHTRGGLVARAHARITAGDLGPDSVEIIECLDRPDHLAFRTVILPNGQPWPPGTFGDPAACRPLDKDLAPRGEAVDKLPQMQQ